LEGPPGPDLIIARGGPIASSSLALSNLRAIAIVIVLAFPSMLAYLLFIPAGARLRQPALRVACIRDRRQPAIFSASI